MNKLNSIAVISVALNILLFPGALFSDEKPAVQNSKTTTVDQNVPSTQQKSKQKSIANTSKAADQTVVIQNQKDSGVNPSGDTTETTRTTTETTTNLSNDVSIGGSVESETIENTDSSVDAIDSSIDTRTNTGDNNATDSGDTVGESDDAGDDSAQTNDDSSSDSE